MGVLRVGICDDGSAICSEIERIVKEYGKKHDLIQRCGVRERHWWIILRMEMRLIYYSWILI